MSQPFGRSLSALLTVLAIAMLSPYPASSSGIFVEEDVTVLYTLIPGVPGDNFGFVGESIGDIDRDGVPDLIVGAPRDTAGGTIAGAAYVYSGATGALLKKQVGQPFNRLGFSVAAAGDVNGDGVPDYMASGPGAFVGPAPQIGRVLVFSGATHETLLELQGTHHLDIFGFDINTAGDVDGDGTPDIVVGARQDSTALQNAGRVSVYSGSTGTLVWTVEGRSAGALLGAGVSGVSDMNGDAVPDVAVAADGAGVVGGGEAYVLSGVDGTLLRTLTPNPQSARFFGQFFVHDAGDIDADGTSDIFIGDYGDSPQNAPTLGRGYVFSGATNERVRMFAGEVAGDGLGGGRGCGDVDGDGFGDLIIASFNSSAGAFRGGQVYLFSGRNGHVLRTFTGALANRQLGIDALPLGDINADGKTDFLISGGGVAHAVAGR